MTLRALRALVISGIGLLPFPLFPQTSQSDPAALKLTLDQAQQIALKNHPRIGSAVLLAEGAGNAVSAARSAYYPQAAANMTATVANDATTLASGALQTSSLNSRFSSGVTLVQLVTDFNRTASLVNAAKFRYQAANDSVLNARAQILLAVRNAYFGVLGSDSILQAAQATLQSRQLMRRQIAALAQSDLRSSLDVTFAEVLVSEAQLALDQAQTDAQSARAGLAAALGYESVQNFTLEDQAAPAAPDRDLSSLVTDALGARPDLSVLKHNRDAAYQLERAEKKLNYPTVSVLAAGGVIPEHDHTIPRNNYEAAGININIPVFNGGLFAARRSEALRNAEAADKNVQELSIQVAREVRMAWFKADNAYRRLSVTSQLVEQARRAVHLAQARYDAGLGSIVELNQAQTSEISAEIDAAGAKYDYLSRRTELDFTIGALR
ncbi:MAG TPA: TolC family protein [Bryobacteraceae bacterium]|nr:TolC family protein [Bryobacteraceae bacterium]